MKNKYINLNLHLFDNHVNVTTDKRTEGQSYPTYNDLSAEMKTYYDMTLIDEAGPLLVHDQFGQKRPIPQGSGKIIEFRKFATLPKALTPLTEGVTPDGKRLEVTSVTAEVSQYGDYITQSDILELTAIDNTIVEATKLLGKQAGLTLDTVTRNILNSGLNASFASKSSGAAVSERTGLDATCELTVKDVRKAVAKLKGQNAPKINGAYAGIIHPYVSYALMNDPEWKYPHQYKDTTNLYENEIGMVAGVRFVESTEAKVWRTSGSSPHAVFSTLIMGEGAYGVTEISGGGLQTIVKQKGSAGTGDPLDQRSSVGWKAIKTAELLVPQYLVRVESCVADFDNTAEN